MVDLTLPDDSPAPDTGEAAERLVARVQAWQHRHPLARRLPAADIGGLGVIALPFDAPEAGGKPRPLFHQPSLVPGLSHRALVEFAQRHAVIYRPGPADWPLREVERADASTEPAPETRYLLTAAITEPVKPGVQSRRLLIAPEGLAIWGPRPLSRTRVTAAAVVLMLMLIAVLWGLRGRLSPGAATPPPAAMAASAPVPLVVPSAPRPAPVAPTPAAASTPAVAPSRPAAAPVAASAVVPAASVPARAGPALAAIASAVAPVASAPKAVTAPARGPTTPMAPAVSGPPAASSPASAVLPPPPKLLPMPALRGAAASAAAAASVPSAPAPAASVVIPAGPHFALVSVPSKKRAVAEQTLARIRKLLGPAIGNLQAQIMPTPEGFVVTLWPLPTQADAEQLADVLSRRGVPMKWLEF
jgi:hypothetical protein